MWTMGRTVGNGICSIVGLKKSKGYLEVGQYISGKEICGNGRSDMEIY